MKTRQRFGSENREIILTIHDFEMANTAAGLIKFSGEK